MRERLIRLRRWIRAQFPLVELELEPPQRTITIYIVLPGGRLPGVVIREYRKTE